MPTPEEKARQIIDRQLAAAGWTVPDYRSMNLAAAALQRVRASPKRNRAAVLIEPSAELRAVPTKRRRHAHG